MKVLACAAAAMAAFLSCAPASAELNSCTEITALPFTITVQGVYCLKKNLNVNLITDNAITINAGNVTIDFNGFRISNQAPLANTFARGVNARDRNNITLKNGFIRGFYVGVYLDENVTNASSNHLVEGMKIGDSGHVGIWVEGDKAAVRDNRILSIGGGASFNSLGIVLKSADNGLVSDNIISGLSGTFENYGVYADDSILVKVTGNEISDVNGGTIDRAIGLLSIRHAIIARNQFLNIPETGTGGIVDIASSDNIVCRDNEAGGFTATPFSGCDFSNGNRQSFN